MATDNGQPNDPTYEINFEGAIFEWHKATITEDELRNLVGVDAGQQLLEVKFEDNSEIPFPSAGAIELKPGHGFSRKFGFKRG